MASRDSGLPAPSDAADRQSKPRVAKISDSVSNGGMLGLSEAQFYLDAEKRLARPLAWQSLKNREGRVQKHQLEARVKISGTLPRGLFFRVIVTSSLLDTATFQLDCDRPDARRHHTLYRCDWRPYHAHTNAFTGPEEYRGLHFPEGRTHEHWCTDHAVESEDRIRSGDVHCARPVEPDFQDFDTALSYVCARICILHRDHFPKPTMQGDLF